jgi:hypothetical protein
LFFVVINCGDFVCLFVWLVGWLLLLGGDVVVVVVVVLGGVGDCCCY